MHFPHTLTGHRPAQLGLIVLQADETIEQDIRRLIPDQAELFVSRVPCATNVSPDSLSAMQGHLAASAALFPATAHFASVGYACTSGAAQIGAMQVANCVRQGTRADHITDPLSALIAACRVLQIARLGLVSPYTAPVSDRLRQMLAAEGITTPAFGSFDVAEEERVVRIDAASIIRAGQRVAEHSGIDALFLSCTNLRTLNVIDTLERLTGLPVLSSNQVLLWDMLRQTDMRPATTAPGRLFGNSELPAINR